MALTAVRVLIRGLAHRAGSSLAVFLVALVGSSAAAIGPTYFAAARTSIVRDAVSSAAPGLRGLEISAQVELPALAELESASTPVFDAAVPASVRRRTLEPAIESIQGTVVLPDSAHSAGPIVWRTGVCAHVRLVSGACPTARGAVAVSRSTAELAGLRVGSRFTSSAWGALQVSGIYAVPDASGSYWFGHGGTYFPYENGAGPASEGSDVDALFTAESTVAAGNGDPQGTVAIDLVVRPDAVLAGDVRALSHGVRALQSKLLGASGDIQIASDLPGLDHDVSASWRALEISILLVTVQLLVLVWLVMVTVVGDAIATRGPEIALAKLRGRRGPGLLTFALGEPVVLLALALPAGVGAGALACRGLDSVLLRADTPAPTPWTAWPSAWKKSHNHPPSQSAGQSSRSFCCRRANSPCRCWTTTPAFAPG